MGFLKPIKSATEVTNGFITKWLGWGWGWGWGGLRVLDQHQYTNMHTDSLTRSRNCSLAPNFQFTHMTSHQKELFQRKETLHSLMCTGKFT